VHGEIEIAAGVGAADRGALEDEQRMDSSVMLAISS
jgi:hypothetical protein